MKSVRIICLLLIILLLSGCTIKYDLTINKDETITEKIYGTVTNEELDNKDNTDVNTYLYALQMETPLIDGNGIYDKSITSKKNGKEFTFTYDYYHNYSESSVLNKCFQNFEYKETEDKYIFNMTGKFNCLLGKSIEINLTSPFGVLENNADKVKKNKYTWIINDSENVNIHAIILKDVLYEQKKDSIPTIIKIVGTGVFIIVLISAVMIYKKRISKEQNS